MTEIIQAIRGMNDILPAESVHWQYAEKILQKVLQSHHYQEIRFPLLEKTELFKRTIGEATEVVEKEMYTFLDRSEDSLTLRPEGTASTVRLGLEHGLFYNQIQRLWYLGPFFRYERPQKGRCRQFHQLGVEIFGLAGPDVDAELILLSATLLEKLGIKSVVKLQLNSIGSSESRKNYVHLLKKYFTTHVDQLDEDSKRRLHHNPMRILDSKNPDLKELIADAPKITEHLDPESRQHFEKLQDYLTQLGLDFEVNPYLVRGLDYYTKTVFEWVSDKLGAQATVCAGGRYDGLVEQLGGKSTPALGFALGMERALLLMAQTPSKHLGEPILHGYIMAETDAGFVAALKLANTLPNKVPGLRLMLHCGGGSLKNQFKKADKSGAQFAIIIGEHELKNHSLAIKFLREDTPQQTLYLDELAEYLKLKIGKK